MPAKDQAAYMRDYRARKGGKEPTPAEHLAFKQSETRAAGRIMAASDLAEKDQRIAELEEEIKRLKQELALRPKVVKAPEFPPIELGEPEPDDGSIGPGFVFPRAKTGRSPFVHLPPADREFMERKLRGGKK